jgi:hypothetical protein
MSDKRNKIKNKLNKIQGKSFQPTIIEAVPMDEEWKEHWKDMPEFAHFDGASVARIVVHIRTDEDLEEFRQLMGQNITKLTKWIWFPKLVKENLQTKVCVDEPKPKRKK